MRSFISVAPTVVPFLLAVLAGGEVEGADPLPTDTGRLTITHELTPGTSYCTAEFVRGETLVRTRVIHGFNEPTGDSDTVGDMLPIYLVVIGRASATETPMRTVEELISALKAGGHRVSADGKSADGKTRENSLTSVQVYTLAPVPNLVPPTAPSVPK